MIIVKLSGGLGNQMFEYAAARKLALKHNTILKLDISDYDDNSFRKYGLKYFNIQEKIATPSDILRIYPLEGIKQIINKYLGKNGKLLTATLDSKFSIWRKNVGRYYNYNPSSNKIEKLMLGKVVSQRFFHYDAEVLNCPDNVYMIGTWISEKYFKDIKEIISNEFTAKTPLEGENKKKSTEIANTNSVSLHIRRTDKVGNSAYVNLSINYYIRAMNLISQKVEKPHFFVFSDDILWVKDNLKTDFKVTFVDHNDDLTSYEDMRLMSLCKYNIIAESTFSWWGAWLNSNPDKIIIAPSPRLWINLDNFDTRDIVPEGWITLSII